MKEMVSGLLDGLLFQLTREPVLTGRLARERLGTEWGRGVAEVGRKWRALKHRGDVDWTSMCHLALAWPGASEVRHRPQGVKVVWPVCGIHCTRLRALLAPLLSESFSLHPFLWPWTWRGGKVGFPFCILCLSHHLWETFVRGQEHWVHYSS